MHRKKHSKQTQLQLTFQVLRIRFRNQIQGYAMHCLLLKNTSKVRLWNILTSQIFDFYTLRVLPIQSNLVLTDMSYSGHFTI